MGIVCGLTKATAIAAYRMFKDREKLAERPRPVAAKEQYRPTRTFVVTLTLGHVRPARPDL